MERGDRDLIDKCDYLGRVPMHYTAYYGDYRETKNLLECGSLVDPIDFDGHTPKELAILRGHVHVALLLDFHEKFFYAVVMGNLNNCSFAINNKPPPSLYARRRDGYTALGIARKEGHSLLAKIFWEIMNTDFLKFERAITYFQTKYPVAGNSVYLC
jgi:ankyrin repeat protein